MPDTTDHPPRCPVHGLELLPRPIRDGGRDWYCGVPGCLAVARTLLQQWCAGDLIRQALEDAAPPATKIPEGEELTIDRINSLLREIEGGLTPSCRGRAVEVTPAMRSASGFLWDAAQRAKR